MSCRKLFKYLQLTLTPVCMFVFVSVSPILAQCQALFSTVPVPGSFSDAGATCVASALVDLGNGTVADRANHLLWAKDVAYLPGGVGDSYEPYCGQLVLGGRTGWSLPDVAQLQTLLPPGTCQTVMNGCGTGNPDLPGQNGITWSSSGVSPDTYYCDHIGCPYYGWQVATGLGTQFGYLQDVTGTPPRKRVDAGTYTQSNAVRCVTGGLNLAITLDPVNPVIVPANSVTNLNSILTEAHLSLALTDSVGPVSGVLLTLRSDRPTLDQFVGTIKATGADGKTEAFVETFTQPGVSNIDSTTPLVWTNPKGIVTWLPARYVTPFLTTCYRTDLESDYTDPFLAATKYRWCSATPTGRTYRLAFMRDVQRQGSGVSVQNEVVQYLASRRCYYLSNCPTTATGACAQVGVTAAVDPNVIPLRAAINVDTLGGRSAQDSGNAITGYHIDIYNGAGIAACAGWSNPNLAVTFVNY